MSSVRGAPGVSSWALILAAAWPHGADRVLVEADGSGGIVGARYDIALEPGVAGLLTQVRRGSFLDGFQLPSVARLLRSPGPAEEGLWAVPAPLSSHESLAAWMTLARPAAAAMAADPRLWMADCGRVWAGSPIEPLLATAQLNIVVSDDSVPALLVLPSRVRSIPGHVALVVVGRSKHTEAELREFTGASSVWRVPHVPQLAEQAGQLISQQKRARRSKVWQTALTIAHALAEEAAPAPSAAAAVSPHEMVQP